MKRGYYIYEVYSEYGMAVVANTAREAKRIAFRSGYIGNEWLETTSRWIRNANVTGLEKGILDDLHEGLLRGFYSYIEGDCDDCGEETVLCAHNGKALCDECIEKEYAKEAKRLNIEEERGSK